MLSYHVHMRYLNLLMGLVNRCIVGFKFKSGYCLRQCIMDVWITHQLHFVSSSFNPVSPSVKHKIKIKETGRFHFAKISTEKETNRTMWKYCKRGFLWFEWSHQSISSTDPKLELCTKQVEQCESTAREVSFEWSHHRISFTDSKVRTTYEINRTMWKYCEKGSIWMVTP